MFKLPSGFVGCKSSSLSDSVEMCARARGDVPGDRLSDVVGYCVGRAGASAGSPARARAGVPEATAPAGLVIESTSDTECFSPEGPSFFMPSGQLRLGALRRWMKLYLLCVDAFDAFPGRWAMLTLTYRAIGGWRPKDISGLLKCMREWCRRRRVTVPFFWVAELQERGAPHYHILVKLPKGLTLPKPDKQGWWRHGWTKVEWVRKCAEAYLGKYLQKGEWASKGGACFPCGMRIFGYSRCHLVDEGLLLWRYKRSPGWVREQTSAYEPAVRVDRVWMDIDGHVLRSPWCVTVVPGGVEFCKRASKPWEMLTADEVKGFYLRHQGRAMFAIGSMGTGEVVDSFGEVLSDWAKSGVWSVYKAREALERGAK